MAKYKDKNIFETDLELGNKYRKEYLNSIETFVKNEFEKAFESKAFKAGISFLK